MITPDVSANATNLERATLLIAEVRQKCVALGIEPRQFAMLLLPEALLAMMVSGMRQEEVEEAFNRFVSDDVVEWFLQVKRTAGYCDCEREARGLHEATCSFNAGVARAIAADVSTASAGGLSSA